MGRQRRDAVVRMRVVRAIDHAEELAPRSQQKPARMDQGLFRWCFGGFLFLAGFNEQGRKESRERQVRGEADEHADDEQLAGAYTQASQERNPGAESLHHHGLVPSGDHVVHEKRAVFPADVGRGRPIPPNLDSADLWHAIRRNEG